MEFEAEQSVLVHVYVCVCVGGGRLEKLGHILLKKIYFVSLQLPELAGSMLTDANAALDSRGR